MELILKFNITPQPHQSVKLGRNGIAYTPKKIVDFKNYVRRLTRDQLPTGFEMIGAGTPIIVEYLHYQFTYPKSFSKKKRVSELPKTTKPDLLDNLNKAFIDALEGLVFEQDQNIVEVQSLKKFYGESDCITIKFVY